MHIFKKVCFSMFLTAGILPSYAFSQFNFPKCDLPEGSFPVFNFSEYSCPLPVSFPKVNFPEVNFHRVNLPAGSLPVFKFSEYPFPFPAWYENKNWHPIVTVGLGVATVNSLSKSAYFGPEGFSFETYNYSASRAAQKSAFIGGFAGIEWPLQHGWLLQTGIDYNQPLPYSEKGTFTQGVDAGSTDSYIYHYKILSSQFLLEGKLLSVFKQRYHPYVLAGLGTAINEVYDYATNVPPFLTFTRMYSDNTQTTFSYALGFGVDVDINSRVRAGIGYRFADFGQAKLGVADIDGTGVPGTLGKANLYANELLVQITVALS